MGGPDGAPQTLSRRIVLGWRCSGLITAALLGGGALAGEHFWLDGQDWWPLPSFALAAAVTALAAAIALVMPGLAWRRWRWAIREHDVRLEFGVLWRTSRSIPRLRIQHVDVSVDPIDRLLGLASVTLYTAGTGSGDASIPGLRPPLAEAVREELLAGLERGAGPDDEADEEAPGQGRLFGDGQAGRGGAGGGGGG